MSWQIGLDELTKAINGTVQTAVSQVYQGVSTDTRKSNANLIFFALKGENFDAHDFLQQAKDSGASALVVQTDVQIPGVTVLRVQDTLRALQEFSHYWRHKMKAKIIGITGTNGKTTTKDFSATLISSRYKTVQTKGNLNNYIGLPLSLLSMDESTQMGVFEMGLSIPGEIKTLTQIADPDVVLVTSVGRAHLEGLGTIEAIAENKSHIYQYAPDSAVRVINLDNPYTKKMRNLNGSASAILTFSSEDPTATICFREVTATMTELEIKGTIDGQPGSARVPVFGRHNVSNLMGAAGVALAAGMRPQEIWQALPLCRGYWGRNQIVSLKSGASAIFDAYNANPDSAEALLKNVSRLRVAGKLYGFFGNMLEMGEASADVHQEWGRQVSELDFEKVYFVGPDASSFEAGYRSGRFRKNIIVSNTYEDSLAQDLSHVLSDGDVVLVKGSRGMKLERAVAILQPEGSFSK